MSIADRKHLVELPGTAGLVRIQFVGPDVYTLIQNTVGVIDQAPGDRPQLRLSTNELRKNGLLVKITVRTETGKSHDLMCATEKISSALANLVGQQIPEQGGTSVSLKKIVKASIPRRRNRL